MKGRKVALIRARWHASIVDSAAASFVEAWCSTQREAAVDIFDVPGAFEIPLLARRLGDSGQYDAIVGVAFVVDGGIYRHEFVAQVVVDGLMRAQFDSDVPTFSLVLTPHYFQPTEDHLSFFVDHFRAKGREVAGSVSAMLSTWQSSELPGVA